MEATALPFFFLLIDLPGISELAPKEKTFFFFFKKKGDFSGNGGTQQWHISLSLLVFQKHVPYITFNIKNPDFNLYFLPGIFISNKKFFNCFLHRRFHPLMMKKFCSFLFFIEA